MTTRRITKKQAASAATVLTAEAAAMLRTPPGTPPATGAAPAPATDQGPARHPTAAPAGTPPAATPAGTPVPADATGATDPTGATLVTDPVAILFDHARAAVTAAQRELGDHLLTVPPGQTPHVRMPRVNVEQCVLAMAALLRERPQLAPMVDPAALEAGVVRVHAGFRLADYLSAFQVAVDDTTQVVLDTIWRQSRDAYHNASREAKNDKTIAQAIAPVKVLFQRAPRAQAAVVVAATATHRAHASAARANKAQQKAAAAQQRAAALDPPAAVMAAAAYQGPARPGAAPVPPPEGTPVPPPGTQGTPGTPTGR